jgi:hypothetical protein
MSQTTSMFNSETPYIKFLITTKRLLHIFHIKQLNFCKKKSVIH